MKKLFKWILALAVIIIFLKFNNEYIVTTDYTLQSEKIPASFDGFNIVQVSDLHDGVFGEDNERLVQKVANENPDVIFITGDLIDSRRYDLEQSLRVVERLVVIAPTYFVTGNHEVAVNEISYIYDRLEQLGVKTLKNETSQLTNNNDRICIAGLEDPLMGFNVEQTLARMTDEANNCYTLLLSHRPELFDMYVFEEIDAVFAGHAHGGQIRIPFIGNGLFSPGQGWLPQYTSGIFEENSTSMVVSRGLGNSGFQQRLFNLPEIVSVKLKSS